MSVCKQKQPPSNRGVSWACLGGCLGVHGIWAGGFVSSTGLTAVCRAMPWQGRERRCFEESGPLQSWQLESMHCVLCFTNLAIPGLPGCAVPPAEAGPPNPPPPPPQEIHSAVLSHALSCTADGRRPQHKQMKQALMFATSCHGCTAGSSHMRPAPDKTMQHMFVQLFCSIAVVCA